MSALSFLLLVAASGIMMMAVMTLATVVERRTGNSGWIDVFWTFGLGATGVFGALVAFGDGPIARRLLVAGMVAVWSARLGLHIVQRTRGIADDPRYARLKRDWGDEAPAKLARLLRIQALVSLPLALGIALAAHNPTPSLGWRDWIGMSVFAIGLVGSALADAQLRAFASSGRGGVCDRGLWGWSRHPNYFFECVLWCSYAVIAPAAGYAWGWLALLAPGGVALLLVRISGIPPLEEHMLTKHGEAYRSYQARTSAIVPLPPRTPT